MDRMDSDYTRDSLLSSLCGRNKALSRLKYCLLWVVLQDQSHTDHLFLGYQDHKEQHHFQLCPYKCYSQTGYRLLEYINGIHQHI